jgi:potassium efflux system protein
MGALRSLALGLARAAIWPLYLVLLAYAARVAPWPRSLGILVSAVTTGAAIAILAHELLRWLSWPSGWPERYLGVPQAVARQLGLPGRFVVVAGVVFLTPVYLFDHGLIAPEGKPITAPALGRLLVLGFELLVWGTCARLLRGNSPLLTWLAPSLPPAPDGEPPVVPESAEAEPSTTQDGGRFQPSASSRIYAGLAWFGRRRRLVAGLVLAAIAAIIALDFRGYSFTARRLALGGSQTAVAIALAVVAYRAITGAISRNASRWAQPSRSWAMALTSAMALRARARARGSLGGSSVEAPTSAADVADDDNDEVPLDDLASGLRRLGACAVTTVTLLAIAWIWEVDMALVQFLLKQPLWSADAQTAVTVGDVTVSIVVILLGGLAWRYMSTLFAMTIFPRMPDDPGVRFAFVTLCRYAVLGVTTLFALGAVHLDLAKISVVLAALGVGLGFGLQEIVSNFVCGIILLLERPIRIGDVVTVAGTTGKVDRINIRATTIINADNQSMIVPNREFITGNLVNWTLKDKILRVQIKMSVAYGTDPDRVVALLLGIARADSDVMINPAPSAALEGFGESSLLFALYSFVPEPGLAGEVRHRLCAHIQRRFTQEGIVIPYPTHELHVNGASRGLSRALEMTGDNVLLTHPHRIDAPSPTPPGPHGVAAAAAADTVQEFQASEHHGGAQ